jgi:hypothetical protein
MTYQPEPVFVPEEIIERDIDYAVQYARRGDVSLWVAGYFVWRVVRLYRVDAASNIALEVGKDSSTVENWMHAYELYRKLRNGGNSVLVHCLRKSLTLSHFAAAWEKQRKYDMSNDNVIRHLQQMTDYKRKDETYSVRELEQEIEAEQNASGNTATFAGYWLPRIQTWYAGAVVAKDTPREWLDWFALMPKSEAR